jgi:hypothetical protein
MVSREIPQKLTGQEGPSAFVALREIVCRAAEVDA